MSEAASNARETILRRVRNTVSALPERKPLPEYPEEIARSNVRLASVDIMENFRTNYEVAHGKLFLSAEDVKKYFLEQGWKRGFCDSALRELFQKTFASEIELQTEFEAGNPDSYDFGITGAAGAIAETGSIILSDSTVSDRMGALAPWMHLAVVKRALLHETVAQALSALGNDPYTVWVTGPSKTADVEGILVEGVHGPGVQGVIFVA